MSYAVLPFGPDDIMIRAIRTASPETPRLSGTICGSAALQLRIRTRLAVNTEFLIVRTQKKKTGLPRIGVQYRFHIGLLPQRKQRRRLLR